MKRVERLLTPANVLASLALFFALGGTGWAGQVIGTGAVHTAQLARDAVTTPKIASGAVTKSKLGKGAVTDDAISLGTVTADRLASGVLGGVAGTKISTLNSPAANIPPSNDGTAVTATCAAGQKAVSGGWNAGLYSYTLSEGPTPDGTGWTVVFGTGSAPATVGVSVVCLAP
jgi:hypothetical protein